MLGRYSISSVDHKAATNDCHEEDQLSRLLFSLLRCNLEDNLGTGYEYIGQLLNSTKREQRAIVMHCTGSLPGILDH